MKATTTRGSSGSHGLAMRTPPSHPGAKAAAVLCLILAAATPGRADPNFKIVAQSGQNGIVSIGQSVSINDSGLVAFPATTADGTSIFVGDGDTPPRNLSIDHIAGGASAFVQINNGGQVVTSRGPFFLYTDPVIEYVPYIGPVEVSPGYSDSYGFLQLYDGVGSAAQQTVAAYDLRTLDSGVSGIGPVAQGPFSYIGPAYSLNNKGDAVFLANTSTGLNPTYVMATSGSGGAFNTTPMWIGAQPMIVTTQV